MNEEKTKGKGSKIVYYGLIGLLLLIVFAVAVGLVSYVQNKEMRSRNAMLSIQLDYQKEIAREARSELSVVRAELEAVRGSQTNAGNGGADTLTEEKRKELEALQQQLEELQKEIDPLLAEKNRKLTEGTTIYEDEQVTINYLRVEEDGRKWQVVFWVENKTEKQLTIQDDSIAMDGITLSGSVIMSDEVAPHSKGKVYATLYEEPPTMTPTVISGQLRVYSDTFSNMFYAKFVDVVVG